MKTIKAHPKANLRGYGKYLVKVKGKVQTFKSWRTLTAAKKAVKEHKDKYPKTRKLKFTYVKLAGKSKRPLKYHGKLTKKRGK